MDQDIKYSKTNSNYELKCVCFDPSSNQVELLRNFIDRIKMFCPLDSFVSLIITRYNRKEYSSAFLIRSPSYSFKDNSLLSSLDKILESHTTKTMASIDIWKKERVFTRPSQTEA